MRLNDAPIYARCKSEIVRINNEAPHPASLAGGLDGVVGDRRSAVYRHSPSVALYEPLSGCRGKSHIAILKHLQAPPSGIGNAMAKKHLGNDEQVQRIFVVVKSFAADRGERQI